MSLKVSAPGSLMLFGEHAVLQKKHAIASAINQRIHVTLKARSDDTINLSSVLGDYSTTLKILVPQEPFTFVLTTIAQQKEKLPSGFDLTITSEMSPHFGLGTSAAVTAATACALTTWLEGTFDPMALFHTACAVIREVQGRGSGADVAASIFGGTLLYRMDPLLLEPLNNLFDLTVVYSGSKMKTAEVIAKVTREQKKRPELFSRLFSLMDTITLEAKEAILTQDRTALGELCNLYQGMMEAIGVNNLALAKIIHTLRTFPEIAGAKISGSGLGDCAIGLGLAPNLSTPYPVLPISMSQEGVKIE